MLRSCHERPPLPVPPRPPPAGPPATRACSGSGLSRGPARWGRRPSGRGCRRSRDRARLGVGEPGRVADAGGDVLEPTGRGPRRRRSTAPRRGGRPRTRARTAPHPEQRVERAVGREAGGAADDVGTALVEPWQQARQALLDRVHVPGRDPHGRYGSGAAGTFEDSRQRHRAAAQSSGTEQRHSAAARLVHSRPRPNTLLARDALGSDSIVDVFTDRPLEGNQLGVFTDGRSLDAEQMHGSRAS